MVFSVKIKNLAQKLQKSALLVLLSVFFIFPTMGLLANEPDLPIIIPNDELLTPIELRDGLVLEVTVFEETELTSLEILPSEIQTAVAFVSSDVSAPELAIFCETSNLEKGLLKESELSSQSKTLGICKAASVFENAPEHFSVKSIASPGLFGFLGICLSRSELPSKNFSMLCENSPPKSTTRRSANDWKFLWLPARTIYHLPLSISSSKILKTSILKASMSRIHNTSDISSIWSNATEGSPVTFWLEKRINLPETALVPNLPKSSQQAALEPSALRLNLQSL